MRLIVVGDCVSLQRTTHEPSAVRKDRSVDRKGIKRGACNEKDCSDCDAYYHDPVKGSQCQYCGCFPTKHRRINDSTASLLQHEMSVGDESQPQPAPEIHIIDNGSDTMIYEIDDAGNIVPDGSPTDILDACPASSSTCNQSEQIVLKNKASESNSTPIRGGSQSVPLVSSLSKLSSTSKISENTSKESVRNTNPKSTFDQIISEMSQEQLYELCVPSHLPMRNTVPLSKNDAQFVIRWIAWSMWNVHATSESDFVKVATLALKRYPTIECAFNRPQEKGVPGVVKFLKHFLGYRLTEKKKDVEVQQQLVQQQQQSNKENSVASIKQYENLKLHIIKEMDKMGPSLAVLRTFLSSCRKERRSGLAMQKQDYSSQLLEFPCFKIPELVLWEFIQQEQIGCTKSDLKNRWLDAVPNMATYFLSQSDKIYPPLTEEQATLEILQCLTSAPFFGPKISEGRDRSSLIIDVWKDSIMPLYVFPQKGDPPRLFSLGDDDSITTLVYVEGNAVFKGPIVDALMHIVAVYFVFDLSPSPLTVAAFAFIFGVLMKEKAQNKYKDYPSVVKALEAIGIEVPMSKDS